MAFKKILAAVVAVAAVMPALPAVADDTGLATSLHDVRREGKRTCMSDHFHHGSGSTYADKKRATADAIDSWQGFTAAEYGTDWARFANAGSKKISCSPNSSGWSCSVEARPCK